jgi:cation diffusion facilitator family transporter
VLDQNSVRRKTTVAALSVASNTTLVVLKLLVGLAIGSVSILSEAIHSGMDLIASIIALVAVRVSGQKPDDEHPFGHGKFENISGALEALLIFVAAGWIVYEAIHKLTRPAPLEAVDWGIIVMLISAVANTLVSSLLFRVGRQTESLALQADGWHLRTDVYTSVGVMVALGLIWLGKRLLPGTDLHWIDPVAGIGVALLILKAAWKLTGESVKGLLDTRLTTEEEEEIRRIVREAHPAAVNFHKLRTRQAGAMRFIEMHLLLNRNMSVEEAHDVNDRVALKLKERFPSARVMIHIEPCDDEGNPV